MKQVMNLTFSSSLTDLCEVNSSFDKGTLRIAYIGENRNKTSISKEAFEKSIPTIYNCPIVCNYNRETNELGGHDVEVVRDDKGKLRLICSTDPVGCIPESSKIFWETVTEEDGTEHEYLCAEALLWKRQEAYQKIKEDGCIAQSMEINVKEGKKNGKIFDIQDFEFTAFTLIGVTPCFESASLEFSSNDFLEQFSLMMDELKESVKDAQNNDTTQLEADCNSCYTADTNIEEGGTGTLEDNTKLDDVEMQAENFEAESENDQKMSTEETKVIESADNTDFALNSNIVDEARKALCERKCKTPWGEECNEYWFEDIDFESKEIYAISSKDYVLFGMPFEISGDSIIIDFENKKRKKYVIVDFEEGEESVVSSKAFRSMSENFNIVISEAYKCCDDKDKKICEMEKEIKDLNDYKCGKEKDEEDNKKKCVLEEFADLDGIAEFVELCDNASNYSADELRKECFVIRGMNCTTAKFSLNNKVPKIMVKAEETSEEPYGGIVSKYLNK